MTTQLHCLTVNSMQSHSRVFSLLAGIVFCGSACATSQPTWWQPTPGTSWQIQLQGSINTSHAVQMYDIDLYDTPQQVIDTLHARGAKVVCYFSAGSFEEWRSDANTFAPDVLGNPLADWPGERWLDIRRIDVLGPIMAARLDLANAKHCDGVDADNVDSYTHVTGFPLNAENQRYYNQWLAENAHARGLAIGLKNDLNQINELAPYFDFAVNEQCAQYRECHLLTPFIAANKPVFQIEYQGNKTNVCAAANRLNFDAIFKRLDLKSWRQACR
jgi:hypothetical protein